jgi:hypothetical protein
MVNAKGKTHNQLSTTMVFIKWFLISFQPVVKTDRMRTDKALTETEDCLSGNALKLTGRGEHVSCF